MTASPAALSACWQVRPLAAVSARVWVILGAPPLTSPKVHSELLPDAVNVTVLLAHALHFAADPSMKARASRPTGTS
jgi:hypothetical protein